MSWRESSRSRQQPYVQRVPTMRTGAMTQADVRGSQILAASGYSPVDMVNFFKTLERVDTSKKTNWMADHPAPPDRIARIEKEAQLLHVTSCRAAPSSLTGSG